MLFSKNNRLLLSFHSLFLKRNISKEIRNLHLNSQIEDMIKPENKPKIENNIKSRKELGNINLIHDLYNKFISTNDISLKANIEKDICEALKLLPNDTYPGIKDYEEPKLIKYFGKKKEFTKKVYSFKEIASILRLIRVENLSNFVGPRSYYLIDDLANLEQALINYTLKKLLSKNFKIISVPELLNGHVIENCGMNLNGERTQIFRLDSKYHDSDICLSGTAEMALAGYLSNKTFSKEQLPLRLAAVSRCFRAEISRLSEEKEGIFRVHQFNKVEMFIVTRPGESENALNDILAIQEDLFSELGLHCRILDMPPSELGAPAYRKYDIEAWMPSQKNYYEISSASDCTDFQAKRLGIHLKTTSEVPEFCSTVNGTACAVPRMIMAIVETFQPEKKSPLSIPEVLWPFMPNNKKDLSPSKFLNLRFIKSKLQNNYKIND